MATLMSCSTEDNQTFDQNTEKSISKKGKDTGTNLSLVARDSINPIVTSETYSEPIKPKKD